MSHTVLPVLTVTFVLAVVIVQMQALSIRLSEVFGDD